MHETNPALLDLLENSFAVCIRCNSGPSRGGVVAGFIVKTSYRHGDKDFTDALSGVILGVPHLQGFLATHNSFLPSKLSIGPGPELSEKEMLHILLEQYIRLSSSGSA